MNRIGQAEEVLCFPFPRQQRVRVLMESCRVSVSTTFLFFFFLLLLLLRQRLLLETRASMPLGESCFAGYVLRPGRPVSCNRLLPVSLVLRIMGLSGPRQTRRA
ncbi:hypothetical protein VUR80DRAFT_8686 [Thermomyces stellatus]